VIYLAGPLLIKESERQKRVGDFMQEQRKTYSVYLDGPLTYNDDTPAGFKVEKLSGKRFRSGLYVNTVTGETVNPNSGARAYTFLEDDSIVDQHMCKHAEETREVSLLSRLERRRLYKSKKTEKRRKMYKLRNKK